MNGIPKEVVDYIKELERKIELLTELLGVKQKKEFGQSSEKSRYIFKDGEEAQSGPDAPNIFNEAEKFADENEPGNIIIERHERKPKRTKEELAKTLPVEKIVLGLPIEGQNCNICESGLKEIGKGLVRREVNIIPAKAYIAEIYQVNYSCPACEEETDESNIVKTPVPEPVIKRGLASASSVAHVIYQKYVNSVPFYRQEKDWENHGVEISRATLANWVIYVAMKWFLPLYLYMKAIMLGSPIINADETVVQVLKEEGKTPQSESRMWVYCTGNTKDPAIVLYEYQPSRAGEHAKNFLKGFSGFLVCDAYAGYNKVEGVTLCGCWAHQRRYYEEAMHKGSKAATGIEFCNKLFELEREFEGLPFEERQKKRNGLSKPVLEAYYSWLETVKPLEGSKLAKAVNYSRNQAPQLKAFLLDGRIEISNNRAENKIRPFVVARKNFLFFDTPKGAKSGAICFSIIETAKANGLNPYKYLLYLLTNLPTYIKSGNTEAFDQFLPWSDEVKAYCKNQA